MLLLAASDPKNTTITWCWVCEDSRVVHAFITSRIDGCNTVLAGSPRTTTDRLQRLLNAAAGVVSNTGKFDWGLTHLLDCSTPSCTGSMFRSESSISSEWQFTGVSVPRELLRHPTSDVASRQRLRAATILSYHDIVAARSAVGRSPSLVRWPGMRCLTTSETRRSVPTISGRS